MPATLDLGSLCLSCPSNHLALRLSSKATFSSVSRPLNHLNVAQFDSAHVCVLPATKAQLRLHITWPSFVVVRENVASRLTSAIRDTPFWANMGLQTSFTVESSCLAESSLDIVVSLHTSFHAYQARLTTHRLDKDVPCNHIKPPDGLNHVAFDEASLSLHIELPAPPQSNIVDVDYMLFESSTTLHQLPASVEPLLVTALCLTIIKLPAKALTGFVITELASFKHLADICPAVWRPEYTEAMASRAVFLPTISHAISNALPHLARSMSLRTKLAEIISQESPCAASPTDDTLQTADTSTIQKAVSFRLWHLLHRRMREPTVGRRPKPAKNSGDAINQDQGESADYELILDSAPELEELSIGYDDDNAPAWEALFESPEFDDFQSVGMLGSMLDDTIDTDDSDDPSLFKSSTALASACSETARLNVKISPALHMEEELCLFDSDLLLS